MRVERVADDGERRAVLLSLQALMGSIGSANDAEDHGYLDEAERIRTESCTAVRDLVAHHAFLTELFPKLRWELDSGHILGFGWAEIGREAGAFLEAAGSDTVAAPCTVCSERSSVEAMWAAFLAARPDLAGPDATYESWCFSDNEADANELAVLVLAGRKRATTGDLWSYEAEQERLPEVGDLNLITDWAGNAVCVIRTTSVEILPFESVAEEFAATEGEGDGSLEYWRRVHQEVFSRRLPDIGKAFEPVMPVVCECFEVVYRGEGAKTEGSVGQ